MNDEFAGLIQTPETQTSALYLTETLVDISERPNFLARLSGDEYRQVRAVGREMKFGHSPRYFPRGNNTTVSLSSNPVMCAPITSAHRDVN